MPSPSEVVTALYQQLKTAPSLQSPYRVEKNVAAPAEMTTGEKLVIVRDGDPGEPEIMLGGFRDAFYTHLIDIELFVCHGRDETRDTMYADICAAIGAALESDLTVGGMVQGMEYFSPAPTTAPIEGAADIKEAVIRVAVDYQSNTPLA